MAPLVPPYLAPFHLLELNVISAQDLEKVSGNMKTYAVAWIHNGRKLHTRLDTSGQNNPTWNDKFVFRVDNSFLQDDLSAINIDIYAKSWWRDVLVGSVRVLVGNLVSTQNRRNQHTGSHFLGMEFVALQVRRPSSRFQGIINIGLALLDSSMRSMPLYSHGNSSAVAFRDLIGDGYPLENHEHVIQNFKRKDPVSKTELRRTKSDTSSMITTAIENYIIDQYGRRGKPGSWISGSDIYVQKYAKSGAGSSSLSNSLITSSELRDLKFIEMKQLVLNKEPQNKLTITKFNASDVTAPIITDSELGPSASEVAAAIERELVKQGKKDLPVNEPATSWSLESVEGLQSRLARWRAELPPVFDRSSGISSQPTSSVSGAKLGKHRRRHTDGDGYVSCFGNLCGMHVTIACGAPTKSTKKKEKSK